MRSSGGTGAKGGRLTLVLPPQSMERLNALKEETEASSATEVFKNALRLYEAILAEVKAGKEFCVRDEHGEITSYRFFM